MKLVKQKFDRIKNQQIRNLTRDFTFGPLSFFVLAIFLAIGIAVQSFVYAWLPPQASVPLALMALVATAIVTLLPLWATVILTSGLIWLAIFGVFGPGFFITALAATVGLFLGASVQLVLQWDKVVILRMGRFKCAKGAGILFLVPLIDRIAEYVDTRIRATDFSAEKTLTKDTVPVHVDAIAFWMIWDAEHAVLEVENYLEAVVLSAQTALRDAIGKHDLASLLSKREELGLEIQRALDAKTNPWGVTILSIEITDIIIPKELENALSKQAQAEREKQSRVILGAAEVEIARKFEEAAKQYENNPIALQLRAMNMVYEGIRQNNSMMLMPASILDQMNLGAVLGTAALQKQEQEKTKKTEGDEN